MIKIFGSIVPKFLISNAQKHTESRSRLSIFGRKKTKKDFLSNYIIQKPTTDDFPEIIKLQREALYFDEPLYSSIGITASPILDNATKNALETGLCLVAKCKYDKSIVGAGINEAAHSWDPDMREKFACGVKDPKIRQILLFYAHVQRLPDIWSRYSVDKVFETKDQLSNYIILKANKDDYQEILKLQHDVYYTEEPTCSSLGLCPNPFLDEESLNEMAGGMSLVAKCKFDGHIVGAAINESAHPWDPDMREKFACTIKCPKVRQLLLFYSHIQRLPDIWNRYKVNKVFEASHLFVHKNHRKRGIAMRLLKDSKNLAADCGFKVFRCDATSYYTSKLCEKLKMHLLTEMRYCSYLGRNLEPVFVPPYPHEAVKIYAGVNN